MISSLNSTVSSFATGPLVCTEQYGTSSTDKVTHSAHKSSWARCGACSPSSSTTIKLIGVFPRDQGTTQRIVIDIVIDNDPEMSMETIMDNTLTKNISQHLGVDPSGGISGAETSVSNTGLVDSCTLSVTPNGRQR